jgi:Baseplate J-like protein
MAYAPPTIGTTGLTIPQYADILNLFLSNFQTIYGSTVDLEPSTPDYQFLSIIALAISDNAQLSQLVFNNMSPNFAIGAGLSSLVKLNGLARKVATASTCSVILTGTAGTVVTNGIVQDINGNDWNLPASVTIGSGGTVTVTATCNIVGAINITAPNQITSIQTPTAGWTSVNNGSNVAALGQPIETDAQLRARQAVSQELPSISPVAGTVAAIAAVLGVTRYYLEENPTGSTDANGCPPHSITAVVEGGSLANVAFAIYSKKTIGCATNGDISGSPISETQSVVVTDPNSGNTETINFIQPPAYVPIFIIVNAHPVAGGTLTATQVSAIQAALVAYLNSLQIGAVISYGELIAAAASVNANPDVPAISIRSPFFFGTAASPSTSTDIQLGFYQAAQGITANISVTSV